VPFFSVSLNSDPWSILGGYDLTFIEIGIISVGPTFDIDIVCNKLESGKSEVTSLLNKKLKVGDVVRIIPHKDITDTIEKPCLDSGAVKKAIEAKDDSKTKSRLFKVSVDNQLNFVIKASKNTTICFNCTWLAKGGEYKLMLGNTNYEDIEQWLQMSIDFNQIIRIFIG
jgi:hypothetical protein